MFEIERKFLIIRPESGLLSGFDYSNIEQTYLTGGERVRRRDYPYRTEFTHTVKTAVTAMRRIETEREITADEYAEFLRSADPSRRTLHKTRYIIPYLGKSFELDDFGPEYSHALLEIELENEDEAFTIPPFLTVVREVTDERRYRNSRIASEGFLDE